VRGPVDARALIAEISPFASGAGGVVVAPRGEGAAFAAAGLEPFDVILTVNGVALDDLEDWSSALAGAGSGSTVVVEAQRAGAPVTIEFALE
jgi:general secretion pathway protein C